jgi:hypothetical protein
MSIGELLPDKSVVNERELLARKELGELLEMDGDFWSEIASN